MARLAVFLGPRPPGARAGGAAALRRRRAHLGHAICELREGARICCAIPGGEIERVKAAEALKMQRETQIERASSSLELANKELARAKDLKKSGAIATTRAPEASASACEPSVEPLSAIRTSPTMPDRRR